ncbi:unnamed protein product [Brachionus calyciflorus]|uniref:Uncharacterized protein n=1 Tax=Brachionus calyciflorus TaxID=104777 RepID=A0A813R2I6_9BILA|nr:unnamed protein product [Brachionus calyciflorus]
MDFDNSNINKLLQKNVFNSYTRERENDFNMKYQFLLGYVSNKRVTKIEDSNCNRKLFVSSLDSELTTGWFGFYPLEGLKNKSYSNFYFNQKKNMILAWNIFKIDLYFIESKLYCPSFFLSAISDVAFVENNFLIVAFENKNYITINNWEHFLSKKINTIKILQGHTGNITRLCIVDNDHLLS